MSVAEDQGKVVVGGEAAPRVLGGTRLLRRRLPSFRILRRTLIGYWVLMFCATHWPDVDRFRPESGWPFPEFDRLVHFGLYAVWGLLWWMIFLVSRRAVSRWVIGWVLAGGVVWAAFDECTQAVVGRTPDVIDFVCDVGGLLASLVVFRLYWRFRSGEDRVSA
ncbi:MAG: VanZ family protein [Phycisphaerae bacterium]|nr:VanZ family protein [Phycisphaerae bacterium]